MLPIKSLDGRITLHKAQSTFFIVDREGPLSVFEEQADYLDFSLRDVCRLRPFISWARLESRYLSKCVSESTRVVGGIEHPIRNANRDLRTKAYALLRYVNDLTSMTHGSPVANLHRSRIASKYNSPQIDHDARVLYDLLRTVVTVETEGISSTLILEIGGETFDYEVGTSELHLEEKDGVLKIYVPRDEDRQEICFHSSLPRRLFSWLMTRSGAEQVETIDDEAAVNVMLSVLNCSNSVVSHILTKEGVPGVDIEEIEETAPPSSTPEEEEASPITPTRPNTASPAIPRTNSTGRSANSTPRS